MKNTHHHRDHMPGVRHTGHPASISATRIAQFSQKRACPHVTNANPSRGAIRHTSQNCDSVTADADDVVGFDRCLLLFRYSLNVHSHDVHPCIFDGATMSTPAISVAPRNAVKILLKFGTQVV